MLCSAFAIFLPACACGKATQLSNSAGYENLFNMQPYSKSGLVGMGLVTLFPGPGAELLREQSRVFLFLWLLWKPLSCG